MKTSIFLAVLIPVAGYLLAGERSISLIPVETSTETGKAYAEAAGLAQASEMVVRTPASQTGVETGITVEFRMPEPPPAPKAQGEEIDDVEEAFLTGVREVETGDHWEMVGRRGERGPYQFRIGTWRQHSKMPFMAAHTASATTVAHRHYKWICSTLLQNGYAPSHYNIALVWNAGIGALINGKANQKSRDYASRVTNIALELSTTVIVPKTLKPAQSKVLYLAEITNFAGVRFPSL